MVNKKKKNLSKRYESSFKTKGNGGSKIGVMNWKKVENEVQFFSPAEGRNRINIIPYIIKSKNHPLVKSGEFEVGDKDYVMDVYIHRGVGPSEASVICLKNTYGKPCPVCEQSQVLYKQGKEKEASALKSTRRCFYNVQDLKNPDKLKVFEVSHFLFEKELIDEARDDEEGGFVDFADEETGKEIKFRCSKVSKGGFEFNEFKSFSFEEREENIPEELIEKAISFDEIMVIPTYEEVEKILYGSNEEEDEQEENEEEEKPKKTQNKKSVKKQVVEDEEEETEDEEEETEDEEEETEDEEEEKPKKTASKKSNSKSKCPFGYTFGKDSDEYDECEDCDCWEKCTLSTL